MLNKVEIWCSKFRLEVNLTKTNILHVRPKRKPQSRFMFLFNRNPVPYCQFYKYLGCTINEYLDFAFTAQVQADSAGQALSKIITKMIKNQGFPYNVYSILYNACVCSISGYGSEVFGYEHYDPTFKVHLRAARAFLGMPKNVASFGLVSELNWLMPQYQSRIKMIQYFARLMKTPSNRLMRRVYSWDQHLNNTDQIISWSSEVKSILYDASIFTTFTMLCKCFQREIVKQLNRLFFNFQQERVAIENRNKPKLRTFVKYKDFKTLPPHVYKSLPFLERKMISKARLGILPLRLETARYLRPVLPEEHRHCYCNSGEVESECHVLYTCDKYISLRQVWLSKIVKPDNFLTLPENEKLCITFNEPSNVRHTAQYLIDLMDLRRLLNTQY